MMKKLTLGLLTVTAICAFGFAACSQNKPSESADGLPIEKEEAVSIKISYDKKTGKISWDAIALTKEYKITVTYYRGEETSVTTTETSYVWTLKAGVSLIKVAALDENGKELAVGVQNMELDVDIGAPEKPTGLSYNGANGTLSWDNTENAASYYIEAESITDSSFALAQKLTTSVVSNVKLDLPKGIYKLSVSAVSEEGARGYAETIEWASYEIPDFNTDNDGDGIYQLLDFESERVLELARSAYYREWATGVIGEVEYGVENKSGGTGSQMLLVKQELVKNADGEEVNYFGGVTLRFPEQIEFGSICFDAWRNNYVGFGIMLEDDNGVQVSSSIAWDETESYNRLHTYTITMESLLEKDKNFAGVREITFYSRNGKRCDFWFDNLSYAPVGEIGEIYLSEDKKTISWDKVIGADGYVLKINGEEVYNGTQTQVSLAAAYDSECAYVELAVKKGENEAVRKAEKLLVCYCETCDGFKKSVDGVENAYYLADFTRHGYSENIVAEKGGSCQFINGSHLAYTSEDDWSTAITYTLPTAITKADKVQTLYFTTQRIVGSFSVRVYETSGRYAYANLGTWNQAEVDEANGEWIVLKTKDFTMYAADGTLLENETWDGTIEKIAFRQGGIDVVAPVYSLQNVYYVTYPENFGDLKSGTENEYYLADFTKASYDVCMEAGTGTYAFVEDSHLEYSSADDWSSMVTYHLPDAVTGATSLKFTMKAVKGNIIVRVYQTDGNYMYINFRNGYAEASADWICENTSDIQISHSVRTPDGTTLEGVKWDGTVEKIVFYQSGVTTPTYQIQSITYTKAVTE